MLDIWRKKNYDPYIYVGAKGKFYIFKVNW